jgi:arsenate reductase (glutaredoxin)
MLTCARSPFIESITGALTGMAGDIDLTFILYGIKNCDTMKKARAWLDGRNVAYQFHDYKVAGIDRGQLERWVKAAGWETVLNRAGTTFRQLPVAAKADLDERKAIELMLAQPSMIKRPVLEHDQQLWIGFKPETYERAMDSTSTGK